MNHREQTQLRLNTKRLLALLHRGGRYAHLWTDGGNRSHWFRVDRDNWRASHERAGHEEAGRRVPKPWLRHNVYFSVHPLAEIPPHNSSGRTDRRFISSQTEYICGINALFAEFDGKDYVYSPECKSLWPTNFQELSPAEQQQIRQTSKEQLFYRSPKQFKQRARQQIEALHHPPSVIVDSGGGYHCYWLLRHTVPLDDANREDVELIQHGWVQLVGGDSGAADLRRVLRLPGSYNHKPGFGSTPPRVDFVTTNFGLLYDYQELEQSVNEWLYIQQQRQRRILLQRRRRQMRRVATGTTPPADDSVAAARHAARLRFNAQHRIQDLLVAHGYQLCFAQEKQARLARPGRDQRRSSVTIFPTQAAGSPERSVHFSTNDPLHSREYVDPISGKVRRQVHDAFSIFVVLEHQGDWDAAYRELLADTQSAKNDTSVDGEPDGKSGTELEGQKIVKDAGN